MVFYNQKSILSPFAKKAKFGNKSNVYNGRVYHSIKEANYAATLDMLKKATNPNERVKEWSPQYSVDIYIDGVTLTTKPTHTKLFRIIPDFLVTYEDGHEEIHEVKSAFTATLGDWRNKWKILEAVMNHEQPELVLRVIK